VALMHCIHVSGKETTWLVILEVAAAWLVGSWWNKHLCVCHCFWGEVSRASGTAPFCAAVHGWRLA